jgi:germination protein M
MTGNSNTPRAKRPKSGRLPLRLFLILFAIFGFLVLAALATLILKSQMPGKALPFAPSAPSAISDLPPLPSIDEPTAADQPLLAANQFRFFFTDDGIKLHPQVAEMTPPDGQDRLRYVLEEFLKGPASDALKSPLPQGVELRGAYMIGDMAVVDFTDPIVKKPVGGTSSELLCVYSIVNTIIENVNGTRTVRILVEGQPRPVLWEQVDISGGLSKDVSLIQY